MTKETHTYEVKLNWNHDTKGTLSSDDLPVKIEVATPPQFPGGIEGVWTPEHLLTAAVNACLMATFIAIASNSKIEYISYESRALGTVEKVDGKYIVTELLIEPMVVAPVGQDENRIKRIFEMSEKACAISNSIKSKVILNPLIVIR